MKNEPSSQKNEQQRSLDEAFAQKPHMRARLLEIADMIDQAVAEGCTAHEAEARAIEQVRKLGNAVLSEWATKAEPEARGRALEENPKLIRYGKKKADVAFDLRGYLRGGTSIALGAAR